MENAIFRAVSLCEGTELTTADVEFSNSQPLKSPHGSELTYDNITNYKEALEAFEKELFTNLYPQHPSSRKLAKVLGVSHTTVAEKLKKYGLT